MRRGVSCADGGLRPYSRHSQSADLAAVLQPRRHPRRRCIDAVRRCRRGADAASPHAAGERLMATTIVAIAGAAVKSDEQDRASALPTIAAGLPSPSAGGEAAALPEHRFAQNRAERRSRLSFALLSFLLFVAIPTAVAGGYFFLFAADQYVAEFRFGLRSAERSSADAGMLNQAIPAPLQTVVDSYAVVQYIGSRAAVDDLGKTIDLRRMFSTKDADWLARLRLPVTIEELIAYWRGQIDAFFDPTNGTIVVRARAFTPADALTLAQGILVSSERLVNDLSARARRDAVGNSERDVREAE